MIKNSRLITVRSLIFNRQIYLSLAGLIIQVLQSILAFLARTELLPFYDLWYPCALKNPLWEHSCDGQKFYLQITGY